MALISLPEKIKLQGYWETREVYIDGERLSPTESLSVRNHSPDGFNWSYGGSGPSQLALAILLKYLPTNLAVAYYQDFKWKVIAELPKEDFTRVIRLREIVTLIQNPRANV